MKVLHVINNLTSGGAEKLVVDLVPYFKENGIIVDILMLTRKGSVYQEADFPADVRVFASKLDLYNPIQLFRIMRRMKNYDIVHVHLFPSQYWVAFAKRFLSTRTKLITTEHNTFNNRMKYSFLQPIERFVYSSYDKIVSISDQTQRQLQMWLNLKSTRFITIENGVNLNLYHQAKAYSKKSLHGSVKRDDILIIMVARLAQQKDHLTLLKAMKILPLGYKLLLVGEGEKEEEYRQFCETNDLSSRVIFLGFRTDVPRLLKTADFCVVSSHWEGFGLSAVEAMASGIPVFASDVPGLREVVSGAGILFEKGNWVELSQKIMHINGNSSHRKQIIAEQRERSQLYHIRYTAEKYSTLYSTKAFHE